MRQFICVILLLSAWHSYSQLGKVPSFFNIQRDTPLVELTTTITVSVADYDARVDDGVDDIAAIKKAIDAAARLASLQNPVRLLFEKGTYDLMPDLSSSHAIEMKDVNGLVWDGQDAVFLLHNPSVGFLSLLRCKNTIIRDFSVDYASLPFTQGKITKVEAASGYFEFKVDDGFPLPTESVFADASERWGMIKNANGSLKKGTPNLIAHKRFFELVAPRTYKYANQLGNLNNVAVGDYFVHIARNNGRTIIRNNSGKNLTYFNITVHASPAGGFNAFNSEEWNIINSKIKLKEGRVHTLNADCIHVNGGYIAPWVENCLFEGNADDCVNLKYTKRVIKAVHSSTQLTVEGNVFLQENIEFYNPRDGLILGNAGVTKVENLGSNLYKITLSNPINITTIRDPDHQSTDKAYVESRSNQSFIFRNNIVRNTRRYGLLIQSKYALIENNLFENLSSAAISIQNGVDWGEGYRATDIVIDKNTMINCGFDTSYKKEENSAAIKVDFMKLGQPCNTSTRWCGDVTSDAQGHSNIIITDNKIIYNKKGVYLKNINGLKLHNNFICHSGQDINLGSNDRPISQTIVNSSNVSIIDFNYTLPNADLHFVLDEISSDETVINRGANSNVNLKINTQSNELIIQGHIDREVGYCMAVKTEGNGNLTLVDGTTGQSFVGATSNAARSYAFWLKPEKKVFQTLLFSGDPSEGEVFSIQMQSNMVVRVTNNNNNFVLMADMPLDINAWNHIVVIVPEGGNIQDISLYKNGIPSSETYIGFNDKINTTARPILFFPRFEGKISDIRYFEYSLCNGEVNEIFKDRYISEMTILPTTKEYTIGVYPTIATNSIFFSEPITSVEVFDLQGKSVLKKEGLALEFTDITTIDAGFYIVKINKSQIVKIIKK